MEALSSALPRRVPLRALGHAVLAGAREQAALPQTPASTPRGQVLHSYIARSKCWNVRSDPSARHHPPGTAHHRSLLPPADQPVSHRAVHQPGHAPDEAAELLASSYRSSLDLAAEHDCRTVAFPNISTGVYGYPKPEAAVVAYRTVLDWSVNNRNAIDEITFVCFDQENFGLYEALRGGS